MNRQSLFLIRILDLLAKGVCVHLLQRIDTLGKNLEIAIRMGHEIVFRTALVRKLALQKRTKPSIITLRQHVDLAHSFATSREIVDSEFSIGNPRPAPLVS